MSIDFEDDGEVHVDQFAPAAKVASHPYGIVWEGPWHEASLSFGQVTRRMVRAIQEAGMPVSLKMPPGCDTLLTHEMDGSVFRELGCSVNEEGTAESRKAGVDETLYNHDGAISASLDRILVTIHHAIPRFDVLRNILEPPSSRFSDTNKVRELDKYRILLTALEVDRVPDQASVPLLQRFGQVWVPCQRNADVLKKAGVERVHVVPHPMPRDRMFELANSKRNAAKDKSTYTFYTIGKWEPRKNHLGMIRAYLRQFGPVENKTRLLIKTSSFGMFSDYPKNAEEALKIALEDERIKKLGWTEESARKHVLWNTSAMSEEQIVELHGFGDCYVAASHGEAWDMGAFDALIAGSSLIHTGFGGSEDYAWSPMWDEKNGKTEVAHPGYRWGIARWAKVDEDTMSAQMFNLFNRRSVPENFLKPGAISRCQPMTVGKKCIELILENCGLTKENLDAWRLQARKSSRHRCGDGRAVQAGRDLRPQPALGHRPARRAARSGGQAGGQAHATLQERG